jgi:pimeloyl-ACP methyl ester carboxylesterase
MASAVNGVADPEYGRSMSDLGIRSSHVSANGIDFALLEAGPVDGPLALCLHGFPDSAHTWRHLLPRLADAGYHAVAPFSRGYAPTSLPADGCYQSGALAKDAVELHEVLGGDERAVIIGHDWGAPAVHGATVYAPERWRRVVSMAVPPGGALAFAIAGNLAQLKRSWYMFFFQHGLADFVVGNNDFAYIDMLWADWSPGYDASVDLPYVKDCLRDPAHLAAALGYYRASLGDGYKDPALDGYQAAVQQIPPQPTLYVHGSDDGCIGIEVAQAAAASFGPNVTVEIFDGLGHFAHLQDPDRVNARILEFLA